MPNYNRQITLTTRDADSGPLYDVYYSIDCINYTICIDGSSVSLPTVGSTAIITLPDNSSCIKLVNLSVGCFSNEVVQIINPTTTTTTTAGPTTTSTTSTSTTSTTSTSTTSTSTTSTSTTSTTTSGPTYNYYDVTRFDCPSCTNPTYSLVARNNTTYGTLTTSNYYNNGDGYVYRIDGYNAGSSYTINLDAAASAGTNCSLTCAI